MENLLPEKVFMPPPTRASILAHFAALEDPRQRARVLYPLEEILLLTLAATIAGADDFVEVTLWGAEHQDSLRRFHAYEDGIPSHDTRCDVFAALDPGKLRACFQARVADFRAGIPGLIAIGGETSRRSRDRGKGRKALYMVSVRACGQRIVPGQKATEEKSNEITAIPLLLNNLDLNGPIVTVDAMGTRTKIAQAARAAGNRHSRPIVTAT